MTAIMSAACCMALDGAGRSRPARERNEKAIQHWVQHAWPRIKKRPPPEATLVFVDESGFSLLPTACHTWSPRGQTPILRHCFNWPKLSAISAVTLNPRAYLHLVPGSIQP
jgi:hypothetical protein